MAPWDEVTARYDKRVQNPDFSYLEPLAKLAYQLSKSKWNWLVPGTSLMALTLHLPQHPWPGPFICIVATPRGLVVELFQKVGCLMAKAAPPHPLDVLPDYVTDMQRMVA
jgi:hypothetical protein